jgi:hypothetical protein
MHERLMIDSTVPALTHATILATPLRELITVTTEYCKIGGKFVLSEILDN